MNFIRLTNNNTIICKKKKIENVDKFTPCCQTSKGHHSKLLHNLSNNSPLVKKINCVIATWQPTYKWEHKEMMSIDYQRAKNYLCWTSKLSIGGFNAKNHKDLIFWSYKWIKTIKTKVQNQKLENKKNPSQLKHLRPTIQLYLHKFIIFMKNRRPLNH